MYAHVTDGSVDYMGSLPQSWRNISGLNLSDGDSSFLKPLGWLPIIETNVTPTSNEVFDSDEVIINEDNVQVVHRVRSMTVEELTVRDMESWTDMRSMRNNKLASTDFYALPLDEASIFQNNVTIGFEILDDSPGYLTYGEIVSDS